MQAENESSCSQLTSIDLLNRPPNPGSDKAIDEFGCTCPYWDNHRGVGRWDEQSKTFLFWINQDCPLHGEAV
jgi:hypothetical protein